MESKVIFICPHTHWDREWYKPFEEYRNQLLELTKNILDNEIPDFKFTFDGQSVILEDVLSIYPHFIEKIKYLVESRNILFGPWYTQPDQNLVSGESLIRNIQFGISVAKEITGDYLKIGYVPDMFGHISQLGPIFSLFSITHLFMWRGVPPSINTSEFYWISPAGTKTLVTNLYESYSDGVYLPTTIEKLSTEITTSVERRAHKQITNAILIMNGTDHTFPQLELGNLINKLSLPNLKITFGTFQDYSDFVQKRIFLTHNLPQIKGELRDSTNAPVLTGVYSTRIFLKQLNAKIQRLYEDYLYPLHSLFATKCNFNFLPEIDYGMKLLLQAHSHDCICGCSIDQVHQEMSIKLLKSQQSGNSVLNKILKCLKNTLPILTKFTTETIQTLAVNPHNFSFQGLLPISIEMANNKIFEEDNQVLILQANNNEQVEFVVSKTEAFVLKDYGISSIHFNRVSEMIRKMVDSVYTPVDYTLDQSKNPPELLVTFSHTASSSTFSFDKLQSDLKQVTIPANVMLRIVFQSLPIIQGLIWVNIPPYSIQKFTFLESRTIKPSPLCNFLHVNENISVQLDNSNLFLKDLKNSSLIPFVSLVDEPDTGDEYNFSPLYDQEIIAELDSNRLLENNSIYSSFLLTYSIPIPKELVNNRKERSKDLISHTIELQLIFFKVEKQINLKISFLNHSKDHRLRLKISLPFGQGKFYTATAFHVLERPINQSKIIQLKEDQVEVTPVTHPQGEFSTLTFPKEDLSLTVINDGLPEVEAQFIDNITSVFVTLVRSIGWLSRSDLLTRKGHAGPELQTPDAQCLNAHECNLAIVFSQKPIWTDIYAKAKAFLSPPSTFISSTSLNFDHVGPNRLHFDKSVIVTGYDQAESGYIIRGVNYCDEKAIIKLNNSTCFKITPIGDVIAKITSDLVLQPWELFTIKILFN